MYQVPSDPNPILYQVSSDDSESFKLKKENSVSYLLSIDLYSPAPPPPPSMFLSPSPIQPPTPSPSSPSSPSSSGSSDMSTSSSLPKSTLLRTPKDTSSTSHPQTQTQVEWAGDEFLNLGDGQNGPTNWNSRFREICSQQRALQEDQKRLMPHKILQQRRRGRFRTEFHKEKKLREGKELSLSATEVLSRMEGLNLELLALTQNFIQAANIYSRLIILERFVPIESKTIKPVSMGSFFFYF